MPKIESVEDLRRLKRKQLQKLAKKNAIKANLSSEKIIEQLKPLFFPDDMYNPNPNSNNFENENSQNENSSSKRIRICGHSILFKTIQKSFLRL